MNLGTDEQIGLHERLLIEIAGALGVEFKPQEAPRPTRPARKRTPEEVEAFFNRGKEVS